ncbi:MAG: NADPH-dependent 7-cyano-7-deazaguanine reductase QueF [Candidatus Hydrogenedentes bacterium]|nr:NADPH-dependent 7-cyano-7-deazaguanine reductase QueF [Candidatus Hydrogenedentota bacterium]
MESKESKKHTFIAQDKTLPFVGVEEIDAACLECFDYEYANTPSGQTMEIVTKTDEFTSVCPFSGLPDFAQIIISYVPNQHCLELRSLKYYLLSYRNVGVWYEHLINHMLENLVDACKPRQMKIEIICKARGGLTSTVTARYNAVMPT